MSQFELICPDVESGQSLPLQFTREGANLSPALTWQYLPAGTSHLALICHDPDAPEGRWIHWVIFNIPANWQGLSQNFPRLRECNGCSQGINSYRTIGYDGPLPPRGERHRYIFRVFALSRPLKLSPGIPAAQLELAMKPVLLGQAELVTLYQRN